MRWKSWLFALALLAVTNVTTFIFNTHITRGIDLVKIMVSVKEVQGESEEPSYESCLEQPEKRIYIGIAIPDALVEEDEQKNYKLVKEMLFYKDETSFCYVSTEKQLGYHAYIFHPVRKKLLGE